MRLRSWLLPAAALFSGCATVAPIDQQRADAAWTSRRAKLEQVQHFSVQARAVATGALSGSANLNWHQGPTEFDLKVSGPLGIGALSMAGDEHDVRVRTKEGSFTTTDPEGTLREKLGWTLPINRLRYWVLSLPSPQSDYDVKLDQEGLVRTLSQDGWLLEYTDYVDVAKRELPRRILLTQGGLKLRVLVDAWSDLPQ